MTSANIVGYQTATIAAQKYKAFGVHFSEVGNAGAGVAIDKIGTWSSLSAATSFGAADQIWRWDYESNAWAKYAYYGTRQLAAAWRKYDTVAKTWAELGEKDVLKQGDTFLYFRQNSKALNLTLAGEIMELKASAEYTVESQKYKFIAYPWPVELKIADMQVGKYLSSLSAATSFGAADQIWRWDYTANAWAKYAYYGTRQLAAAWRKYDTVAKTWSELGDDDKIGVDEGFLYFRQNSKALTITFTLDNN